MLSKSDNPVLHLASEHRSRPTPLKDALIELDLTHEELVDFATQASNLLQRFPRMAADVELATLRAHASKHPTRLAVVVDAFPSLRQDPRARSLLDRVDAKRMRDLEDDTLLFDVLGQHGLEGTITIEGIMNACADRQRTLNDVRRLIQHDLMVRSEDEMDVYHTALESMLLSSDMKTSRQFYVAALRELGELNAEFGVRFGEAFDARMEDSRGTRSYIVFLNRVGDTPRAIQLLEQGIIEDEEWVAATLSRLREKEELRMLEATFTSNLDVALERGLPSLQAYMDAAYGESTRKKDLAYVFFRFVHPMYKEERSEALAKLAIHWGERILDHSKGFQHHRHPRLERIHHAGRHPCSTECVERSW